MDVERSSGPTDLYHPSSHTGGAVEIFAQPVELSHPIHRYILQLCARRATHPLCSEIINPVIKYMPKDVH